MSLLSHDDLRRIARDRLASRDDRPLDDPDVVLRVGANPLDLSGSLLGVGSTFDLSLYLPAADGRYSKEVHTVFVDAITGECVDVAATRKGEATEIRYAAFMPDDAGELVEVALAAHARYVRVVPPTSKSEAEIWMMVGDTLHLWRRMTADRHAILDANLSAERTKASLAGRFVGRLSNADFDRRGDGRVDAVLVCTNEEDARSEAENARRALATTVVRDPAVPPPGEDLERACDPDRLRELGNALEARRRPATYMTPDATVTPRRTGSFLRGRPAWPHGMAWPTTLDGKPLDFLCQVACVDLVGLPDFPCVGLLQFFVSDEGYGADAGADGGVPQGTRVVWHPSPDFPIDEAAIPAARPRPGIPFDASEGAMALVLSAATMTEGSGEASFDANNPGFTHGYGAERCELLNDVPAGVHYVGGWPRSVLGMVAYGPDDVVLARFDSDETLCWGRSGTAHFMIGAEDLMARRFGRARFEWDSA